MTGAPVDLIDEVAAMLKLPLVSLERLRLTLVRGSAPRLEASYGAELQGDSMRSIYYRLSALARPEPEIVVCEWGSVDPEAGVAYRPDGSTLRLTPKQRAVLMVLARHPNHFVSNKDILREAWGREFVHEAHYVRLFVASLRNRLGDRRPFRFIEGHTGGYLLRAVPQMKGGDS